MIPTLYVIRDFSLMDGEWARSPRSPRRTHNFTSVINHKTTEYELPLTVSHPNELRECDSSLHQTAKLRISKRITKTPLLADLTITQFRCTNIDHFVPEVKALFYKREIRSNGQLCVSQGKSAFSLFISKSTPAGILKRRSNTIIFIYKRTSIRLRLSTTYPRPRTHISPAETPLHGIDDYSLILHSGSAILQHGSNNECRAVSPSLLTD